MTAYYNEIDPYAAQWLLNLIAAGHIPSGDVDKRSIVDVRSEDLKGYTQCHFFAGIGGWSLALRLAEWDDTRSVWTGSCPCQPFSSAGKQDGHADERHLWPHWFRLIRECRPATVFGEQVAGAVAFGWLDEVFNDLEAAAYSCAAAVLPACSVGAPHRRDRLWFVANSIDGQLSEARGRQVERDGQRNDDKADAMGDTEYDGRNGRSFTSGHDASVRNDAQGESRTIESSGTGESSDVAYTKSHDRRPGFCDGEQAGNGQRQPADDGGAPLIMENPESVGRSEWRPESTGQQGQLGFASASTSCGYVDYAFGDGRRKGRHDNGEHERLIADATDQQPMGNTERAGLEGQPGDVESSGEGEAE